MRAAAIDANVAVWPSAARAWWAVAIFALCAVLSYTDRYALSPLVDPIRADLAITDTQMGVVQGAAFALVYAFLGLPLGRMVDRRPRRIIMIFGVFTWTAAVAACGLAGDYHGLLIARLFIGIGEAALAPAAFSMISDYFPPRQRGAPLACFLAATCVGQGSGIAVSGGLLQAAQDGLFGAIPFIGHLAPWRIVLLLLAPPGLLACLLLLTVNEPERREMASSASQPFSTRDAIRMLLEQRRLMVPIWAGLALMTIGEGAFFGWVPTLMKRTHDLSDGVANSLLGGIAIVAGVVGTFAGGLLGDLASRRGGADKRLLLGAWACLLGAGSAVVAFNFSAGLVVVAFGIWILGFNTVQTCGISAVQQIMPNEMRGIGISSIAFAEIMVGLTIGPMLTGGLTQFVFRDPTQLGWSIGTVVIVCAPMAAILIYVAARAARRPDPAFGGRG